MARKAKVSAPTPRPTRKKREDDFRDGVVGSELALASGGGFQNRLTGLGTLERDKVRHGTYIQPIRLPDPELSALFNGNDLARRIVELRPKEMFRRGYDLLIPDPTGKAGQHEQSELAQEVTKYGDALGLNDKVKDSFTFGRLFGGGLLIVGADDGRDMAKPLNEKNIRSIKYLNFIDRRFLFARTYYGDPFAPHYGEPETYQVTSLFGQQEFTAVHESRCIRFDGAAVEILMRRQLAGWTLSVLQAPFDALRMFDTSFQAVSNLMTDMSQAVFKMKGLIQMITSKRVGELRARMQMVDMMRSSGRMMLLDSEGEEFERKPTPMSGVPETMDRFLIRMASAAEMPVTVLFGQSPAGLNATGESDFRSFYDTIAGEQTTICQPKLKRLYELICLAKDSPAKGSIPEGGFEFCWHKLWEPNEKELSEIHVNQANADKVYLEAGVLTPSEVAMSRFRGGQLSLETEVDIAARKKMLPHELDLQVQTKKLAAENGPLNPNAPPGEQPNSQVPAVGAPDRPPLGVPQP